MYSPNSKGYKIFLKKNNAKKCYKWVPRRKIGLHLHSLENGNYCYNPSNQLPVDTWSSIDISQYYDINTTSFVYRVKVQGEVIGSVVNTAAQVCYMGDSQFDRGYWIFKNDVTAKMRFLDPPCHHSSLFWFTPSPSMSPVQTMYENHVKIKKVEKIFMVTSPLASTPFPPCHP